MIIDDMIAHISQGMNLADSMAKHKYIFDNTETELVRAAQNMGNMPETLEEISNELENYKKITSKIK
jgi:type II secretory pathway component PulF